ncbi:hypothetical protein NLG97_g550 [Lecanicillium saksenae]|uniref:Uncharacterized protein n=1 Tax=Lecanicillium saksenae TaxID=468837 RepID=A0ACC1RAF4_9HYPO|nr:hypothetical protein NLG97_g550 [Lecanicillium saksenae]
MSAVPKASVEDILKHYDYKPELVERINPRKEALPLAIEEPKAEWPARFAVLEAKIKKALGDTALEISHVGSTSVPGLPAKDIIDIDLTVADILDEDAQRGTITITSLSTERIGATSDVFGPGWPAETAGPDTC